VCWAGLTEKKKKNGKPKTEEKGKGSLTTSAKLRRRIFDQTQNIIKLATERPFLKNVNSFHGFYAASDKQII
jgi:hypothetical protein